MHLHEIIFFSSFIALILLVLLIDLGVFNKKSHIISIKEASIWTIAWVVLALAFYVLLYFHGDWIHGMKNNEELRVIVEKYMHPINVSSNNYNINLQTYRSNLALEYLSGYLIEKALSVDNIFVILLVFYAFGVKEKFYHKVLYWGIIGAIVLRFLFIFLSAALIQKFSWILYGFGGLLIITGIKMFINRNVEEKIEPQKHPIVKFISKYLPVFPRFVGGKFFIKRNQKIFLTPLFIVLVVIEFSDLIFAVDSIPAIFAVTKDPYIVFFSNIFAILGLRTLFFIVAHVINIFHYLKIGLAILLTFIGFKMIFGHYLSQHGFTTAHSLFIILGILIISILASIIFPQKQTT